MPILNYTTKVPPAKTAGEIVWILGRKGAEEIHQQFTAGRVTGIAFVLSVSGHPVRFQLPVNFEGVLQHMKKARARGAATREQAERVAWRIVKDWVEVQIALVESNQAEMAQVFMPYALLDNGRTTAYAQFSLAASRQNALGNGD